MVTIKLANDRIQVYKFCQAVKINLGFHLTVTTSEISEKGGGGVVHETGQFRPLPKSSYRDIGSIRTKELMSSYSE